MKQTALYSKHIDLNAKMVSFAGFEMPIQYSGIIKEHLAVRENGGIFDLSHMGEFEIRGSDSEAFLQKMTINDVNQIKVGQAQYTAMCYENGGIVDDCILYRMDDHFLLVVNASNIEKDWQWLEKHLEGDVNLYDVSYETSLIAVQGPKARNILERVVDNSKLLNNLQFLHHAKVNIRSIDLLFTRTGYTGELGFELYIKDDKGAQYLWDLIMECGEEFGISPVGLGARDSLRLEMAYCLYGNDIDETINPIEASLGWITKIGAKDFIGKEPIRKINENKPSRRLVTFSMLERGIPRHGYKIFIEAEEVGIVTSGGHSPSLKNGIGMGYVRRGSTKPGTEIQIEIRGKGVKAKVIKPPLWKKGSLMD